MSDDERRTNEQMQKSAELARRNVEFLKKQAAEPKPPPAKRHHRGTRGGRRNLSPTSQAQLTHRLDGVAQFVKAPPVAESLIPE